MYCDGYSFLINKKNSITKSTVTRTAGSILKVGPGESEEQPAKEWRVSLKSSEADGRKSAKCYRSVAGSNVHILAAFSSVHQSVYMRNYMWCAANLSCLSITAAYIWIICSCISVINSSMALKDFH